MTDEVDEFLEHFGVKGMHWGVIRNRDTSSGASSKTVTPQKTARREARAQKSIGRANAYQTRIDQIHTQVNPGYLARRRNASEIKDLTKYKQQALADAEKQRQGKLTDGQKKVIIGAAIVTAIVAGTVINHNIESGNFQRLAVKGKAALGNKEAASFAKKELFGRKNLDPSIVHAAVVRGINPDYGKIGTKNNCRRCTFAYEMRRRGLNVVATKTTDGTGQGQIGLVKAAQSTANFTKSFLGENPISSANSAGILDHLSKEPDGSRGELAVKWAIGGAHSMAYEIFNGKPVIFDTQTGDKLDTVEKLAAHGLDKLSEAAITRLDNRPLDTDFLLKWVKNAK